MTEFDKILLKMETLDTGLDPEVESSPESYTHNDSGFLYQENIDNSLAEILLGSHDYDPNCTYQIVHMKDATVLLKVDATARDSENPVDKKITEYIIDSDDVISYEEMMNDVRTDVILATDKIENNKVRTSSAWMIVSVSTMLIMLILGLILIACVVL